MSLAAAFLSLSPKAARQQGKAAKAKLETCCAIVVEETSLINIHSPSHGSIGPPTGRHHACIRCTVRPSCIRPRAALEGKQRPVASVGWCWVLTGDELMFGGSQRAGE